MHLRVTGLTFRRAALLTVIILSCACRVLAGVASGGSITVDHIDGVVGTTGIQVGQVTMYLRLTVSGGVGVNMISNGFRIYSPDGATWSGLKCDTLNGVLSGFTLGKAVNYFSADGSGADTIGVLATNMSRALPPGYSQIAFAISFVTNAGDVGETICIDSSMFRPSNTWKWTLDNFSTAYPSWDGPHCFQVMASTPQIAITPTSLTFTAIEDAAPPPGQDVAISNSGIGTLNWSATSSQTWLGVNPPSDNSNNAIIHVSVLTTNLPVGTHDGVISVSSTNANNSPQIVNVSYVVQPSTSSLDGIVLEGEFLTVLSDVKVDLKQGSTVQFSTTTDASGNYSFPSIPSGGYNVVYSKVGYVTIDNPVTLFQGPNNLGDVKLFRDVPPPPPVVTAVRDPGTGDKFVVEWNNPGEVYITDYDVDVAIVQGTHSGPFVTRKATGADNYRQIVSSKGLMAPNFLAVRSRNIFSGKTSEWVTANSPDTAVYATIPIVMVHGWNKNTKGEETWRTMDGWLSNDHFNYRLIAQLDPCGPEGEKFFDKNAQTLSEQVETFRASLAAKTGISFSRVNIIAHSMGGMISRRYATGDDNWAAHAKGIRVDRLFMLGTPNRGVSAATFVYESEVERCAGRLPQISAADCLAALGGIGLGSIVCNGPANGEFAEGNILAFNSSPHFNKYRSEVRLIGIAGLQRMYGIAASNDGFISKSSVLEAQLTLPGSAPQDLVDKAWSYGPIDVIDYTKGGLGWLHGKLPEAQDIYIAMIRPELLGQAPTQTVFSPLSMSPATDTSEAYYTYAFTDSIAGLINYSRDLRVWKSTKLIMDALDLGGGLHFGLISPDGTVFDSTLIQTESLSYGVMDELTQIVIPNPQPGNWRIAIRADSLLAPVWPYFICVQLTDSVSAKFTISPAFPKPGDTLQLSCRLSAGTQPISDAEVTCTGYSDSANSIADFVLKDDGTQGDPVAGDGEYTYRWAPIDSLGVVTLAMRAVGRDSSFIKNSPLFVTVDPRWCCNGTTGNVNMAGIVDLADLSSLVSYLTGGGYVLPCSSEANLNAAGIVDLADLSALVSYLTGGGYVLPNCP